jgi:uncharacterized protein (DUF1501 family)
MNGRRLFLKSSGLALVTFGAVPRLLLQAAYATERMGRRALVVVFQRGACDGLNTVIPWDDGRYHAARKTIALPAPRGSATDRALDLDGFFGFHPALAPLVPLWKEGTLAAVHAVGSPDPTRSHFDAQDYMESGTPGRKSTEDGWMNRHLKARPDPAATALRAVSLTPTLPRALQGTAAAVAMTDVRRFGLRPGSGSAIARGFEGMYGAAVQDSLHGTSQAAFEAMDVVQRLERSAPTAPGVRYPRGSLGPQLRQIAQLVKADVGLELAFAETGNWDHHAAQGGATGQQANRLRELGRALAAFRQDLGPRLDDVVLATLTEFGRTVRENGNRGTDHGHGSVSLVMGGPVAGGKVHGRWPGLRASELYQERDLAVTTDFRDLLAELLGRHLGCPGLETVFPGHETSSARYPGVLT